MSYDNIHRKTGYIATWDWPMNNLGYLHMQQNNYDSAGYYFRKTLELVSLYDYPIIKTAAHINLAELARQAEALQAAESERQRLAAQVEALHEVVRQLAPRNPNSTA